MLTNIKAEIIYYTIPTDFELEFHLNGCCPMRLLTKTVDNNNELISALSGAFSHNKVVMITGPLEQNIIEFIGKSIGFNTETPNPDKYFFTEDKLNAVISGSVPLITEDGILGGCIVESGPQSLILVTSEKTVQREIIRKFIEPYLHALSNIENDIEEENSEQIPENTIDCEETENTSSDIKTEEFFNEAFDDTELINDQDFEEFFAVPQEKSKKGLHIITLIIVVILLGIMCLMVYALLYIPLSNNISIYENIQQIFSFLV